MNFFDPNVMTKSIKTTFKMSRLIISVQLYSKTDKIRLKITHFIRKFFIKFDLISTFKSKTIKDQHILTI